MQLIRGERHPTVTPDAILGFFGEYRYLSNFHPCRIRIDDIDYPSTEHAYMAYKSLDRAERLHIASLISPNKAKQYGQTMKLRPDWDSFRLVAMLHVLTVKFSDPVLAQKLLATGDKHLEETNNWKDRYWGVDGTGANHLGKLLMLVRGNLRLTMPEVKPQLYLF